MNESEWLASGNPLEMIWFLRGHAGAAKRRQYLSREQSERKQRLFVVSLCRRTAHLNDDERSLQSIDIAERYADGQAAAEELQAAHALAKAAYAELRPQPNAAAYCAACSPMVATQDKVTLDDCEYAADVARMAPAAISSSDDDEAPSYDTGRLADESRAIADTLRDVYGNPFHSEAMQAGPVAEHLREIAQRMYAERRFDAMSQLRAALEPVAWANDAWLGHCDSKAPHTRGCWVLDAVLGRMRTSDDQSAN